MESFNFKIDFIERTLSLIKDQNITLKTNYDVTLLINCMIGIIYVDDFFEQKTYKEKSAKQKYLRYLNEYFICPEKSLIGNRYQQIKGIRNAVAHHRIESINEDGLIKSLKFTDIKKNATSPHFMRIITVENLKKFVIKTGELVLEFEKNKLGLLRFNK